jgi:hypothetical protein
MDGGSVAVELPLGLAERGIVYVGPSVKLAIGNRMAEVKDETMGSLVVIFLSLRDKEKASIGGRRLCWRRNRIVL